jgi:chemosensory pili system protein ChpC
MAALLDATTVSEIVTMLLPAKGRNLLIPNVCFAEIIRLSPPRKVDNTPGWFRGMASWRGLEIPVVSYEALNDDPFVAVESDLKAAVLNSVVEGDELPFYAIATQGTPRLVRVTPEEIVQCEGATIGPAELMAANVCGEEVGLPNLAWIEQELLKVMRAINDCPSAGLRLA